MKRLTRLMAMVAAVVMGAGLGAGSAQAATTNSVIDLGLQDSGTYLSDGTLMLKIAKGTLPVGSILRSVPINVRVDSGDPYPGDMCLYFADFDGANPVLRVGDAYEGNPPRAATEVLWDAGTSYGNNETIIKTITAGIPPIDLNNYAVFIASGYPGTWSGTITLEYDIPEPATIVAFGITGSAAIIDQVAKTIAWTVPYGTAVTNLAPEYTLVSGTCDPASGSTNDFTSPVTYTVSDGSTTNAYTVTVTVAGLPDELNVSTYSGTSGSGNLDPISNLMAVTPSASGATTSKIDYHGGTWSLPGSPTGEHFSILWEGWFDVTKDGSGVYTFGTSSDDGSVLYLDLNDDGDFADAGERIVNNNQDQADTSATGEVDLQMTAVHMVIGYYQAGGGYDMRAAFKKGSGLGFGALTLVNSSWGYFSAFPPGPPAAPTGLVATPWHHSVHLDWTATLGATGYKVDRLDGTGGSAVATYDASGTSYTDTDGTLVDGTNYYYVVRATNSAGEGPNSDEAFAAPSADPVAQTITFGPLAPKTVGSAPFALTATASSGLPVSYASSDTNVATVSGSTVTILKAGTTTITASQAGNGDFNPATPVDQPLVVQAIPAGLVCWYDAEVGVTTDGSGVSAWEDKSGNGHNATRAGGTPTLAPNQLNSKPAVQLRGGNSWLDCALTMFTKEQYVVARSARTDETWGGYGAFLGRASGRGSTYVLAPDNGYFWTDQAPLAVSKNGTVVPPTAYDNHAYNVAPVSNYMILKIIVNDNDTSAASYRIGDVDDNHGCPLDIAEILGFDTTLSADDEAAVGSYLADKYAVTSAYPLLRAPAAPTGLTASPLLHAVLLTWTSSWSAASYNVYRGTESGIYDPTPIGTTNGTTYTDTHAPADDGTNFFYVVSGVNAIGEGLRSAEASAAPSSGKVDQTITFGPLASKTYGDAPFALTGTASSGLPVSYASSDQLVASVSGSTVTVWKAGTTIITASQAGDDGFNAALPVDQTLTVSKTNQTITFALALRLVRGLNALPFADSATGGASGNPVTYSSSNEGVATVDSTGLVTIVAVGTTEIRANQLGDADHYNDAPQVSQTLIVIAPPLPVKDGLACWYDAGYGVTVDGSGVSAWEDRSGLGHQAIRNHGAPSLVLNDVNGRPAVHIRGGDQFLDCAGGMFTKEQYVVVRSPSATWNGSGSFLGRASQDFLSVRASSYNLYNTYTGFWDDHLPAAVSKNGTAVSSSPGSMPRGGFELGTITDYMLLKITVNDAASAANLAAYPYYQIGQNETLGSCDMDIAEIIGYDSALSPADEALVGSYLAYKYGLDTEYPRIKPPPTGVTLIIR